MNMIAGWGDLSFNQKKVIIRFALAIVAIYFLITYFGATAMYRNKALSDSNHIARMSPTTTEPTDTPLNALSVNGTCTDITVGTYVDSIESFSIKDSVWNATFYIWFNWR